ncbi:MAG: hypothetical protein J6Q79_07950, partial [Clostridia bacterium]|nr:hypothetical protein [Clostridia bacterium]
KKQIKASELKVLSFEKTAQEENNIYTIVFKPFRVFDSKLSLKLIYSAANDNPVIRKHIELSFDKRGNKAVALECIDF